MNFNYFFIVYLLKTEGGRGKGEFTSNITITKKKELLKFKLNYVLTVGNSISFIFIFGGSEDSELDVSILLFIMSLSFSEFIFFIYIYVFSSEYQVGNVKLQ